jgi:tight adherence protein B
MSDEALIPFLAVFFATAILFVLGWYYVTSAVSRRRAHQARRINGLSDSETTLVLPEALPDQRPKSWLQRFDRGFDDMIAKTGLDLDTSLALALVVFCGVVPAAIMFVWRYEEEPWVAIPAFFLGMAVPLVFFWWRQGVWRRRLQNQLPDALYLMARSLRAGRSIDQAIQLVGEQGVPPLSREFARMHRQMDLQLPLAQVLEGAAKRLGLVDFNVFASVLRLHRATGGNLPVVLDRLAAATRDHNQFEGQYRAATVLGRYSAAFITCLVGFILFYLVFFGREWATPFFETTTGIVLFSVAMTLEACGLMLLFWLLKYEY